MGPVDIAGVPIEVGDTVVYGTKTRESVLNMVTVIALVPFQNTRLIMNPAYNPSKRWDDPVNSGIPVRIKESFTDYKIKFRHPSERFTDYALGVEVEREGRMQTLDNPKRFAVIKKFDPQRRP